MATTKPKKLRAVPDASEPSDPQLAELCQYQKYTTVRVHRSELQNAPYNPRKIDQRAKDKLKRNLKTVGLTEAPSWNGLTGNLLSGHQRLAILDILVGHDNYLLDVCRVELDEKTEREQNVFVNNPMAQGDWDMTALAPLLKREDFDHVASGWDRLDLEVVFTDDELSGMFKPDEVSKEVFADLGRMAPKPPPQLQAATGGAEGEAAGQETGEPSDEADGGGQDPGPSDADSAGAGAVPGAVPQRRSDAVKEYMKTRDAQNDSELYAVVVFEKRAHREIFMSAMGSQTNERYLDGAKVFSKLGIDPEGEWAREFGDGKSADHTTALPSS